MEWVLDTSVTMAWCFDDEKSARTESLLERLAKSPAIVPALWPFEVANVLITATRRKRIDPVSRARFVLMLEGHPILVDGGDARRVLSTALPLAEAHKISAYDAAYLELAMRMGIPLATLDRELAKAARNEGVDVL
jgi:predicted nucleic acid-binding protein